MEGLAIIFPLAFVILYGIKFNKNSFYEDYISIEKTTALRGAMALCIAIHHFSSYFDNLGVLLPFKYIGYLIVGIFFFLSGYGLMYGYKNKCNYIKHFLKNRLSGILIPLFTATLMCALVSDITKNFISAKDFLLSILGIKVIILGGWYPYVLVVLYIIFFVVFKFIKKENVKLISVTVATVIAIVVFYVLGENVSARSLLAFPCGLIWGYYKDRIDATIKKHYFLYLIISGTLFALFSVGKFLAYSNSMDLVTLIFELLSSLFICILLVIITFKVQIKNKILSFLGKISYEIYLTHWLVFATIDKLTPLRDNIPLFGIISFVVIIPLSYLLNIFNRFIMRNIKNLKIIVKV